MESWQLANELFTKMMPQNVEAEQAVIGSALFDKDVIPVILEVVKPDYFYRQDHRAIFECILELFDNGLDIDILTVADLLKQKGTLEEAGGMEYLDKLVNGVPTTSNVRSYAKIVEEKALLRRLIKHSDMIADMSYKEAYEVEYIMNQAERGIFDIFQNRSGREYAHIEDVLSDALEKIEELYNNEGNITGISTGFNDLDHRTAGLHNSDLIFLACRPSMGKTAFVTNIAQYAATKQNIPVAIFSLEMSREQLANRMICSEGFIDNTRLSTGKLEDDDWAKLGDAITILSNAPIYIDDTAGITMTEIRSKCRRLKMEKDIGLVVIDYLQLIEGSKHNENRQQEISEISRSMKILAKELDVPILCAAQLSRAVEQRGDKRPILSDLRESGSIEQDADIVMFIYRDEYYNEDTEKKNIAEISIAKHRNGSTGKFELVFLGQYTKFGNIDNAQGLD